MNLLEIRKGKKRFGRTCVLREIDLILNRGFVGVIGANGSGKSTLLRVLATTLRLDQGSLLWNGIDISKHPDVLRGVLGYVPQNFGAYPSLTGTEHLRYLASLKGIGPGDLRKEVDRVVVAAGMDAFSSHRISSYSGGMLQRLGLAQAALGCPRIMILDEPGAALDAEGQEALRRVVAHQTTAGLAIVSTHAYGELEAADWLICLANGRVAWQGSPQTLLSDWTGRIREVNLSGRPPNDWKVLDVQTRAEGVATRIVSTRADHGIAVTPTFSEACKAQVLTSGSDTVA